VLLHCCLGFVSAADVSKCETEFLQLLKIEFWLNFMLRLCWWCRWLCYWSFGGGVGSNCGVLLMLGSKLAYFLQLSLIIVALHSSFCVKKKWLKRQKFICEISMSWGWCSLQWQNIG
jgi:hypothetical protein